jgi:hypothetical protein
MDKNHDQEAERGMFEQSPEYSFVRPVRGTRTQGMFERHGQEV